MPDYSGELRNFRETVEPIAAAVYFSPEPIQALAALGLGPLEGYFCGRAAAMGKVSGETVRSIFAFFNPKVAVPATESGWQKASPEDVLHARLYGISSCMRRLLGPDLDPDLVRVTETLSGAMESLDGSGRPLFAAWRSVEIPDDPHLRLWRACDLFREHRGAAHVAAWLISELPPREAVTLSKYWWRMESNSYLAVHGWSDSDVAEAEERLRSLGYLDEEGITDKGRALRDEVEDLTDRMQRDAVEAIGGRLSELASALAGASRAVVEARAYPLSKVPSRA